MATEINKLRDSSPHFPGDENASSGREVEGAEREGREPEGSEHQHTIQWRDKGRIAFVAAGAAMLWFLRTGPTSHGQAEVGQNAPPGSFRHGLTVLSVGPPRSLETSEKTLQPSAPMMHQ